MAPKRGPSSSSLAPQQSLSPSTSAQPRSPSPSSGFTQFLTRPSKWFSRSASASKVPSAVADPRPSVSSGGGRKHKISRPTDPRPILETYAAGSGSKSVLDLSARQQSSMELSRFNAPSMPSSPIMTTSGSGGLGDLRNISRKGWSRSADDLNKASSPQHFSPVSTSFQERIAEYRGRSGSNASAIPPSSPVSQHSNAPINPPPNARHPFPSIGTPPPIAIPPRSSTLPSLSITTPTGEERPGPQSSSHVHTRSHSFTPKLPSKLAAPAAAPGFPSTPKRSNERDQDADARAAPFGYGPGAGGAQSKPAHSHDPAAAAGNTSNTRTTTLLPPPTIVEPGHENGAQDLPDLKRSSQIVFHSGFINRLADIPVNSNQANLSLAKGWKPFKMEMKGSKLYFYKPPSDKAAGIKELFPTQLMPPTLEEMEEMANAASVQADEAEGSGGRSRKAGGREDGNPPGRKKRAYWGRRTHPDLVKDANDAIEKGTLEALIHEAVFATTFPGVNTASAPDSSETTDTGELKAKWYDFASTVLFGLPPLVGRQTFEAEFTRCCSYLVSGADAELKEAEQGRVAWLAKEYIRYHGPPVDLDAWEELKNETIPGVSLDVEDKPSSGGLVVSASTQAMFHPTPDPNSESPRFDTLSPRPDGEEKPVSLLDALFAPPPTLQQHDTRGPQSPRKTSPPTNLYPWSALREVGLTRDVLLCLDPHLVARSLTLFHRSVLEQSPENVTVEFVSTTQRPTSDGVDKSAAALFGSDDQPHWLTKLLLLQILGSDNSNPGAYQYPASPAANMASPGRRSEDRGSGQTSRTHSRSELISVWARVGDLCRSTGDECTWRAISAALCSRPIARLEKAWKRVDPQALAAIESWVHVVADGAPSATVAQPQVTPWGGDVRTRIQSTLGKAKADGEPAVDVKVVQEARTIFEEFRTAYALCPRKTVVAENEIGEDARKLALYWREMSEEGGGTSSTAIKFQRVDQVMSLSLAAEPRRKGLFEPYFWTRSNPSQAASMSLVPLLFPDPLPTLTLIDRSKLVRARLDSETGDLQYLRSIDTQLRQEAGRQLQSFENTQDFTKRLILGQGGTLISVYNGDLLLVVQSGGFESAPNSRPSSQMPSRPPSSSVDHGDRAPSRNPSIRVKPSSSHGLDRKTSMARRSSLPSVSHLSNRNFVTTEPSSDPPLRVVVQAGTLDNLVNILVHGLDNISVSVADDNGEMSLREGRTRELMVDRGEFARVWWNVFRSFVTPLVFFELLRKIYLNSQTPASSSSISDNLDSADKRIEVLNTVKEWLTIGSGAQDVLDDTQLHSAVWSFLISPTDHLLFKASMLNVPAIQKAWTSLTDTLRDVKSSFTSQTKRPTITRGLHGQRTPGTRGARQRNISTRDPPDIDGMDAETFVDNLDGMFAAAFSNVTQEDLYITADLLEVQTSDRSGWFLVREAGTADDQVEIQTIYSHIQEIENSSLISELTQDALYKLLPPGVRSCIRAYAIIRKWLISKIVAPRLGLRTRQARLELLIQAIEVARLRNTETPSAPQLMDQPCVRSFVEAVTTSALLSVESRMHHRAWQGVAISRGASCDSLSALLVRPYVRSTSSVDSLTVDMGWLLERMLEIIATPDIMESSLQESPSNLVNFDKRRHLCNLISKADCLPSARKYGSSDESNRRGFERLNNIEKEVLMIQFDHRGIKEEAMKEATTPSMGGGSSARKAIRPFSKIVSIQVEKNRRDKALRTRIQREKLQEQSKNERREDLLNKAMRPRKHPVSNAHKQHRNKKSMSAFLNFMRPISSAFVSDSHQSPGLKRTPSQLDFTPSGKPSLVLSVMDAEVAEFINNERSYTFQLKTEDGGHYLLQAHNKRDMTKWLETISRVTKIAAKRRETYIGPTKTVYKEHILGPILPSRDPKAVFGVELQFLLRREAGGNDIEPGTVPGIIEQCMSEIERRGLTEVGIYRIAGAVTEINALKDAYNRGEYPIKETTDIHAICDLVKSWFRVLPEPLFPPASYHEMMAAMRQDNFDDRLFHIRRVVQGLPQANFDILRRVVEHLDRVTDYEEHNHMTAEALAIVFSPNLLRAPQNDFAMIMHNMGLSNKLVKALITHYHIIFSDADQDEGDIHSEDDEPESPILEEAEEEDEDNYEPMHEPSHDDEKDLPNGRLYTPK